MKTLVLCCLCLVAGVLFGYLIPKGEEGKIDKTNIDGRSYGADGRRTTRPRERSGLDTPEGREGRSNRSDTDSTGFSQDDKQLTVPASLIRELSKGSKIRSVGQALFGRDGEIEKALNMTDQEKATIQTAWRAVAKQVREIESKSSNSEDLDDGSVRITVPDLADTMGSVGNEFQSSVREALGENRGDVFLAMKGVGQVFSPPSGERSYQVSVESVGNGRWRYHMTLEGPTGRRVWVSESIPNEIRHLTDAARILPKMENEPEAPCE